MRSSFWLSTAAASGFATELIAVIAVLPTEGTFDAIIIDYKVPIPCSNRIEFRV